MLSPHRALLGLTALSPLLSSLAAAQAVFCHYMIGTVTAGSGHAEQDIDNAQALGFDAFALNVGQPGADWAQSTVQQLFDHAQSTNFKLFFSLDLLQDGTLSDFSPLLQQYLSHPAYYRAGPNNAPFLSTFSAGSTQPSDWTSFLAQYDPKPYFVPDFDGTQGYYTDTNGWFGSWGGVVDGVFSWETAWPAQGDSPANVSTDADQYVMNGAYANGKAYMMPLSSLQYKHLPDQNTHYYRIGEINLAQRMEEILQLGKDDATFAPDFVELITWNDAGESHYIGNLWPEGIPSYILSYANSTSWPHTAWQPLVASFISAFKAGALSSAMTPPSSTPIGAMWYRTILKSASCSSDPLGKPTGWESAQNAVNYAIVLPHDAQSMSVRVSSGGNELQTVELSPGLNYGSVDGLATGSQKVELLDGSGNAVMSAVSVVDVQADESDGICNFNYQVAGLQ